MNQTEQRIMDIGNQYIIYMLTINDKDKIIYSKLLEFEDGKLEHLIFYQLRNYFWNDCPFFEETDKWDEDEDEDKDEDEDDEELIGSYTIQEFVENEKELDYRIHIFPLMEEVFEIQEKVNDWIQERHGREIGSTEYGNLLEEYLYHFFSENGDMTANEIREYIINLIDPVEPK
jgi:hypothetical protein